MAKRRLMRAGGARMHRQGYSRVTFLLSITDLSPKSVKN
ncbi:hypothetical protein B194_1300 [Serratia plymuthica A30]|nr:hypothetical protein B194_1300 [Serratia plymuthica A30]